jgi:hypothetical protein
MRKIYSIPGQSESGDMAIPDGNCESVGRDMEAKFIEALVEILCDTLSVNWNDRRIIASLLKNNLKDKLDNRWKEEGLLQQYAASQLDEAADRFYYELEIPKEIKVNHEHAPHAKYADIVEWIKKNYKAPEPELKKETK